jgi:hypothetical protein
VNRILPALSALAITVSYSIVYMPPDTARGLLVEDGPIEQATLAFFLLSTLGLIRTWQIHGAHLTSPESREERRFFYLILAFLMFVCAGEEISWGQRIFGWETPESWSAKNAQSETNLHNLVVVEGGVRDLAHQSFFRSLTNANRLFALFSLTFFVIVPALYRISPRARKAFHFFGLPIPPLWIGGLFLLNHLIFHLAARHLVTLHLDSTSLFPLDELKEQNDAFAYAVAGFAAWYRERVRSHAGSFALHKA